MSDKPEALRIADECATGHPLEGDAIGAAVNLRALLARAEAAEARYMALLKSVADGTALQSPPPMLISDPSGLVSMLQARAEAAESERDKREHQLGNIRARIYRDGGQHMVQHGTDEAVRAADDVLAGWIAAVDERDRLRDALIACRPHIDSALSRDPQVRKEQLRLLDTIDAAAAAKGQG